MDRFSFATATRVLLPHGPPQFDLDFKADLAAT